MKLLTILSTLFVASFAAESQPCTAGYWRGGNSENACNWACSPGCSSGLCDETSGACFYEEGASKSCAPGWENKDSTDRCDSPICQFNGVSGCSEGGRCIAPQYCICGTSGAQIVGKHVYNEATGADEGINCVSLRKDGIIGSFIALVVMFVSVSFCGLTERYLTKQKQAKGKVVE